MYYVFYVVIEATSVDIPMMTEDIIFADESLSIIIPRCFIRCRSEATGA